MKNTKNNGSAILTALFIMILVAIAATAMSLRLQIDINRTQLILDTDTMKTYAEQGRLIQIRQLLNNGLSYSAKSKQYIDGNLLPINEKLPNNLKRKITTTDLQSLFNINNLSDKNQVRPFARLLHLVNPKTNPDLTLQIALLTREWVTKPDEQSRKLQSAQYYQSLKNAYLPAHRSFTTVTELRLVKDVSQQIYNSILPYISALPEQSPININTASHSVLMTLGAGLTKEQAKEIINLRKEVKFKNISQLLAHPKIKKLNINTESITLTSKFFLITTEIASTQSQLILFTIVQRDISKKGVKVKIIQETLNTL